MAIKIDHNEDDTYTIKHNGKTYTVTKDELLKAINEMENQNK